MRGLGAITAAAERTAAVPTTASTSTSPRDGTKWERNSSVSQRGNHGRDGDVAERGPTTAAPHIPIRYSPSLCVSLPLSLFAGGLLWFWLLYRLKSDWKFLFFWENPFDSHDEPHSAAHSPEQGQEEHH
jgi:hypothetical protein